MRFPSAGPRLGVGCSFDIRSPALSGEDLEAPPFVIPACDRRCLLAHVDLERFCWRHVESSGVHGHHLQAIRKTSRRLIGKGTLRYRWALLTAPSARRRRCGRKFRALNAGLVEKLKLVDALHANWNNTGDRPTHAVAMYSRSAADSCFISFRRHFTTSPIDTMPSSRPCSTTGM